MSIEQLQKSLQQDSDLLENPGQVFDSIKLVGRNDLSIYNVSLSGKEGPKGDPVPTDAEESFVCSQDLLEAARERQGLVISNLISDISKATDLGISSKELTSRSKAFCRIFEAVIRSDQHRQLQEKNKKAFADPPSAPSVNAKAIKFALNALLHLIKSAAKNNPDVYESIITDANEILEDLPQLALQTAEPILMQSINDMAQFFGEAASGNLALPYEIAVKSFAPLFKIAQATGSLSSFLGLAERLLGPSSNSGPFWKTMIPVLQKFKSFQQASHQAVFWEILEPSKHIIINQDTLVSKKSDVGIVMVTGEYSTGQHYIEILIKEINSKCGFGVSDSNVKAVKDFKERSFFLSLYMSDSSILVQEDIKFKFEKWAVNDRIGVFIDMNAKQVSYFRNGIRHKEEALKITADKVKVLIVCEDATVVLCSNPNYPPEIQGLFEQPREHPTVIGALLAQQASEDEFIKIPKGEIAAFILSKLSTSIGSIEKQTLSKKYTFTKRNPIFGIHVSKANIETLFHLQQRLNAMSINNDYSSFSKDSLILSLTSVIKLLTVHLLGAEDLGDETITPDLKKAILDETLGFLAKTPEGLHSTQAVLLVTSCFEVFYKEPESKLRYIVESLEQDTCKTVEETPISLQIKTMIFKEMSRPDKLFPALQHLEGDYLECVMRLYRLLIHSSEVISSEILQGRSSNTSSIRLLETVQIALFSQASKAGLTDTWSLIIRDYSSRFLESCISVLNSNSFFSESQIQQETLAKVSQTILSNHLLGLLNSLSLFSMDLQLISQTLPLVSEIFQRFSSIQTVPPAIANGVQVYEQVYESDHNYPDNANFTHLVEIPGATSYTLEFDPRFKTENNCDYLQLWLDKSCNNRVARWEGESFPREPLVVNNPFLYFTFKSDGSANYWGWKITIKSLVSVKTVQRFWPETSKDTMALFVSIATARLISGRFDTTELPEELIKVLDNPFLKHGIFDRCLLSVRPLAKVNPDILKLVDCALEEKEFQLAEPLSSRAIVQSNDIGLKSYLTNYGQISGATYSPSVFLQDLIEGKDEVVTCWNQLKQKCSIVGPVMNIGGTELDQAERAIFAVYTAFFEIVDTMARIFSNVNEVGRTVKLFVKESCNIRIWSQKQKQKMIDSGNEDASYKIINDDIVKKCTLLLGCQYKACLQELGVTKVLSNLIKNIAEIQENTTLKQGSKWASVRGAMKSSKILRKLTVIKKKSVKTENEDVKEFMRVSELVRSFLESSVSIDKISNALETIRIRAIARAAGFVFVAKNLKRFAITDENILIKLLSESLKKNEVKLHYGHGLQGVDPYLLASVQKAFFSIIRNLQQEIIPCADMEHNLETYSHILTNIETLSCHLHVTDTHMLLDLPLAGTIKVLLDWSKGNIKEITLRGAFSKKKCITSIVLTTADLIGEGKSKIIVVEKREDSPSLCLAYDISGDELPITSFEIKEDLNHEYGDLLGEFIQNGVTKWIYLKRNEPTPFFNYLTEISDELVPKYLSYADCLDPVDPNLKEKTKKLRQDLCCNSWKLYKQLFFTIVGSWQGTNENQHQQVQDLFLQAIFSEVSMSNALADEINLKKLSAGTSWVGKVMDTAPLTKMQQWLVEFRKDDQKEIAQLIDGYVHEVDDLKTGKVTEILTAETQQLLSNCKNQAGEYDFFKYLDSINTCKDLPDEISSYLEKSPLWNNWEDERVHNDPLNTQDLLVALQREFNPSQENSFSKYLNLFIGSSGLLPKELVVESPIAEFSEGGQLDIYKTLTEVRDNPKYSHYYWELRSFYTLYPRLPAKFSELEEFRKASKDYIGSLLWILYGGFTSPSLSHALSKHNYISTLLRIAFFSTSTTLVTLATRILCRIIPVQHSPGSFTHLWKDEHIGDTNSDIVSMLLTKIGKSQWMNEDKRFGYESKNLLLALITAERWKEYVTQILISSLEEALEFLSQNKVITAMHVGAIFLMSPCDNSNLSPFVLATVTLKESSFGKGIIKEVIDDKNFMVYSAIDDTVIKVDISKITSIDSLSNVDIYPLLPDLQKISELMIQVWISLEDSFSKPLNVELDMLVTLPTLHMSLQSMILTAISAMVMSSDLQFNALLEITSKLINKKSKPATFHSTAYSKILKEIQKRMELLREEFEKSPPVEKNKLELLIEEAEKIKPEEILEKINKLSDDNKMAVAMMESEGLSQEIAIVCVTKGITDYAGYNKYIDEPPKNQIYKLAPIAETDLLMQNQSGTSYFYQNSSNQLILEDSVASHTRLTFSLPCDIFKTIKHICTEVTIRAAIEGIPSDGQSVISLSFGDLNITIANTLITVGGIELCSTSEEVLRFRLSASISGVVEVTLENNSTVITAFSRSVFNGINIGEIGLELDSGAAVHLLLLEIYHGKLTGNPDSTIQRHQSLNAFEKLVKIKTRPPNIDKMRLKLLGIDDTQADSALSSARNLGEAVSYSLKTFSPESYSLSASTDCLIELKIFETADQVPADFQIVKTFEGEREIEFGIENRKVLASKKGKVIDTTKAVIGLSLTDSGVGGSIGELNIAAEDKPNTIYVNFQSGQKREAIIKDIIYIKCNSPYNVIMPPCFTIVCDKDGKAVNIASQQSKCFVFLAIAKITTLSNMAVYPLESIPAKDNNFGLIEGTSVSSSKVEKEVDYSSLSLIELFSQLHAYEDFLSSRVSKDLISSMLKKTPGLVIELSKCCSIEKILDYVDSSAISSLRSLLTDQEFAHSLVSGCVSLLLSSLVGSGSAKRLTIESIHPYKDNMDVDDVIIIPGAKSLRIEFDPQCATESGCDILYFLQQPGRSGTLAKYSGSYSNFKEFEVPGDTVYTYFHSDGSKVDWGYKFDVIPVGSASGINPDIAIDILKEAIRHPSCHELLTSDRFLVPIFMYLLGAQNSEDKDKVLDIMKHIFVSSSSSAHVTAIKAFGEIAGKLYESTKEKKTGSRLLQSILQLLCEAKKHCELHIKDPWFDEITNLLSDMSGVANKNSNFELFVFESFKASEPLLEMTYESEHPYPINTVSQYIHYPGAHALKIEFTPESRCEKRHFALFSEDPEGKSNTEGESQSQTTAVWEHKGPQVAVDKDGTRITRTSSSNWGSGVLGYVCKTGITTFSFLIENCDSSQYIYIGFIEAASDNKYDLSSVVNNEYSKKVWTWRKSGDYHVKGSSTSGESYGKGDTLKFVVNCSMKTITCYKNNKECHVFSNIEAAVVPAVCFGGDNQFIVLTSIEASGGVDLSSKKLTVPGDSVYFNFPANCGYKSKFTWNFNSSDQASISEDKLIVQKVGTTPAIIPTDLQINTARHYFQVRIIKPGKIAVGVSTEAAINEKNISNPSHILLNSEGLIGEYQTEPFAEGDLIGIHLDIDQNLVSFYKNDIQIHTLQGVLTSGTSYKFISILQEPEASLCIVEGSPGHIDLLRIASDLTSSEWGYKFKVVPEFYGRSLEALQVFLSSCPKEFVDKWEACKTTYSNLFVSGAAEELVIYLDQFCPLKSKNPMELTREDVAPTKEELIYYPELEKLVDQQEIIYKLYQMLQNFNKRVEGALYLFDLHLTEHLTDMQKILIGCRGYIFFKTKNDLLAKFLESTKTDTRTEIIIDRPKAARHRLKLETDIAGQFSIFGQIYRALSAISNRGFRNPERIYKVGFRGEASTDAGGPYNETMSNMCDELQSSYLRLLVPSQNNAHNIGETRDGWVINPAANTDSDYTLFTFLGKLMGTAIRTQNNLNLSLPPIFWKKLLREPVSVKELRGMDVCSVQILEILQNPEANGLTAETFGLAYDENFTTHDSSGKIVEVVQGGKNIPVTFENCREYSQLVIKKRLEENPAAYDRIREGMSATMPLDYLNLLSFRQLETLVCGATDVNVPILKENTDYDGCGPTDEHIIFFWEVLNEFTAKERSLYLKFVWGRSRLPSGKNWRHMKITRLKPSGPVNNYMPVTHTCFFTIDLPPYTSKAALHQKLLYAITHCTAIDLDGSAGAGWEEND